MAETKKQESLIQESKDGLARRALGFAKRTAGRLAAIVFIRKQQQNGHCGGKFKSAQDVRDDCQSRCPWWGP